MINLEMKIKKKILKNILIQNLLGFLVAIYIFLVKITSTIQYENQHIPKKYWKNNKSFILAFWHSQLMMISFSWKSKKKINILASKHSDGRFGAIVGKYFNLNNIPASIKGNDFALRPIFQKLKTNEYVGITPDGPRGPKEIVSEGIIKIAQATNTPIIPFGFWSSNNIQLKSWDNFLITLPFSKCCFVWQDPIHVPKQYDKAQINDFTDLLKTKIDDCIKTAKTKI